MSEPDTTQHDHDDETPVTYTVDSPSIDDVLAGNSEDPGDDSEDAPDGSEDAAGEPEMAPSGRFPVENVAERVDPPAASRLPSTPPIDHRPPTADETDEQRARRIEKESMSRGERRRRGW